MTEDGPPELRTDRAHGARIYDYILGGKDNYAIDREAAEAAMAANPSTRAGMQANRNYLHRVARFLAGEHGVRQFLDIGTGIPTSPNLHEVVQEVAPSCRVVYADNDPIVLAHARALLRSHPEGATAYVQGDLRRPSTILDAPELRATLDLTRPIALLLIGVVHFVADPLAYDLVAQLLDALPSGSYLSMSVLTGEFDPEGMAGVARAYQARGETMFLRTKVQAQQFYDGLELLEPGVVQIERWHPAVVPQRAPGPGAAAMYGGVGRKA